ncbi:hypothetical protein LTQ03_20740 [Vibrio splendidus]|uniref:hypothetical protein n=1 Tax=Vibrio splendidus TaxID=29497 RepID=UPI001FB3918E|nr:hypothetical protein [Vibrio splendidus]UOE81540.1 hypothetical protein LTQ03_20740 [Vibrio splendidus]
MVELFFNSPEYMSISGAVLAILGSVVLAFAMSKVFWELGFGIRAISTSIQSMYIQGESVVFGGLDTRIDRAQKYAKLPTFIGILLVCLSLPFQAYSLHLSSNQAQKKEKIEQQREEKLNLKLDTMQLNIESIQQEFKQNHDSNEARLEELRKQQSEIFNDLDERINSLAHNKCINTICYTRRS